MEFNNEGQPVDTLVTGGEIREEEKFDLDQDFQFPEEVVEEEKTVEIEVTPTDEVKPVETEVAPVVEEAPKSELELLKESHANLLKIVGDLSNPKPIPVTSPPITPNEDGAISLNDLLGNIDFDEVMESKDKFVELLKNVVKSSQAEIFKELQTALPNMVVPQIERHTSLQELHREFYSANPELNGLKGYVTQIANEIGGANPDWTVAQVLAETAKTAKVNLGIANVTQQVVNTPEAKVKPTLPGGSGAARGAKGKGGSTLVDEISELFSE